jgi:hypothetical protein
MTKNFTKFLAIGASSALAVAGLSVPASAAGLADKTFVSLLPQTGTEYTVLHDQYFDLKSNAASTIATAGNIKFLVADTTASTLFDVDVNAAGADAVTAAVISNPGISAAAAAMTASTASDSIITIAGHGLAIGDTIVISGVTGTNNADFNETYEIDATSFTVNTFTTTPAINNTGPKTFDASATIVKRISSRNAAGTLLTIHSTAHGLVAGDKVTLAGFSGASLDGTYTSTVVDANSFSIPTTALQAESDANNTSTVTRVNSTVLDTAAAIKSFSTTLGFVSLIGATPVVQTTAFASPSNGRTSVTDGTYVVDSNVATATDDKVLRLVNNTAGNLTVNVTAWVDSNDNGAIDATEYTSEVRAITFKKSTDIVATTSISPIVGDTHLTATITTTPVLNGQQVLAQDPDYVNANFTRQGSTATRIALADWTAISNQTSLWNDTSKSFSVKAGLRVITGVDDIDGVWTGLTAPAAATITGASSSVATTGVVTITSAAHALRVGDKVTLAGSGQTTVNGEKTVASVPSVDTFTVAATTAPTTAIATLSNATYTITTYTQTNSLGTGAAALGNVALVDRVFAGTYSAKATLNAVANGSTASASTASAISAGATVSTSGTATVQGKSFSETDTSTNTTFVKTGTLSVPVTVSVSDVLGVAVGAGRSVSIALTGTGDTFKVNGKSSDVVTTDANGDVTLSITAAAGAAGATLNVKATAENAVNADIDLEWKTATYGIVDLSTTGGRMATTEARSMNELGSYSMNIAVMDEWFQAPAAGAYRLQLTGEGVAAGFVTLTDGRGTVTIADSGVDANATLASVVTLQKLTAAGLVDTSVAYTLNTGLIKSSAVNVSATGSTLYSTDASRLSAAVAKKALVEIDQRVSSTLVPAYGTTNFARITGQVVNATTAAGQRGAVVTVTGPSNILFLNAGGQVYERGTLTFISDATATAGDQGKFEIHAFSTTAQTDSVITVTANGVSKTVKVSFTGIGIGEGTVLTVTTPAAVKPASTFQVGAKLADAYGNGVASATVKVTYTGAGIVFGTLPTTTDANGEIAFSVLLGSNDSGTVSVTVSYDQNADLDYLDAKDLVVTSTTEITASGVADSAAKVNAGSFLGYVAVYAKGHKGSTISWKIAGKWFKTTITSDYQVFQRKTVAVGMDVNVDIYIDSVKVLSKVVATR